MLVFLQRCSMRVSSRNELRPLGSDSAEFEDTATCSADVSSILTCKIEFQVEASAVEFGA